MKLNANCYQKLTCLFQAGVGNTKMGQHAITSGFPLSSII